MHAGADDDISGRLGKFCHDITLCPAPWARSDAASAGSLQFRGVVSILLADRCGGSQSSSSRDEHRNGDVRIEQVIHIEKESQKGMVVGKGGQSIKRIREQAQASLQELLDHKVHLFIRVKVSKNWANDPDRYREWGLNFEA